MADTQIAELGHVHHCQRCLWRDHQHGLLVDPTGAPEECPNCGEHLQIAGPLWLGPTCDPDFTETVRPHLTDDLGTADETDDLLVTLGNELEEPTHYDQHRLTKRWGVGAPGMDDFLDGLREAGFDASRTHYGGTTFKTDADVTEIRAATVE